MGAITICVTAFAIYADDIYLMTQNAEWCYAGSCVLKDAMPSVVMMCVIIPSVVAPLTAVLFKSVFPIPKTTPSKTELIFTKCKRSHSYSP